MRVAEVLNGIVTHFPPFWKSVSEIPEGVAPIYFDAPDEVQEGWLFDGEKFSKPPEEEPEEIEIEEPSMTIEQATNMMMAVRMFGLDLSIEQQAEAATVIAEAAGIEVISHEAIGREPEILPFRTGEYVTNGSIRTYNTIDYICIQSHITQADWTPDKVPALWSTYREPIITTGPVQWIAGEAVSIGDERWYGNSSTIYICLQSHITQVGWEPPKVASLWKLK